MFKKLRESLAVRITLLVFLSVLLAQMLTFTVFALLFRAGVLKPKDSFILYLIFAFVASLSLETIISAVFSRVISGAYETYKTALSEIASGNFDVTIPESQEMLTKQFVRDINKMTRELKNNQIMRNDFISNFSHELKTPIVSINGFSELLMADDITDEERKEYAGIIYSESGRLLNLAKNTLLLSKLEGQSVVCNKKVFLLNECVENCALLFEKQLKTKNSEIKMSLEKISYYWDPDLVSQIVINLLSNAIKYGKENGVITVTLKSFNGYVYLTVRDDGEGMDEATLARVFDRYFQGDDSHKTEGNGLGLSIVKRIVDIGEGKISVESKVGEGSAFTVTLPERLPG